MGTAETTTNPITSVKYRYTGEGMEELEFTEAESNIADLIVRASGG